MFTSFLGGEDDAASQTTGQARMAGRRKRGRGGEARSSARGGFTLGNLQVVGSGLQWMDGMDEMVEARDGMDGWKDREGGGIVPGDRRHNTE